MPTNAPAKARDPWFDNAKMALVALVVVGHSWTLLPKTGLNDHLYDFLYAWHVPAFVMVTGYLSRSFTWERRRLWQLVRTVLVPYLLFECALALFRVHVGGERLEDLFTDPHWPMWYLAALFCWRLLTPVFTWLPVVLGVGVAVAASLLAGLYAGDTLDSARILGLLPFFVIGLAATPDRLEHLRSARARVAAVAVLGAIAVAAAWTDRWGRTEWFYYRAQYDELTVSDTRAFLIRAALLVVGTLGAWAFLALVPRAGGWFSRMGAFTLVVYLFHGFAVKGAEYAGFPGWAAEHAVVSLLLTTLAAVALAFLLSWRPLASRLAHLVDPLGFAQGTVDQAVEVVAAKQDADVLSEVISEVISDGISDAADATPAAEPGAATGHGPGAGSLPRMAAEDALR